MRWVEVSIAGRGRPVEAADWSAAPRGTGLAVHGCGVGRLRRGEGLPDAVARWAPDELRLPAGHAWTPGTGPRLAALLRPALDASCVVVVGSDAFRPGSPLDALVLELVAAGLDPAARRRAPRYRLRALTSGPGLELEQQLAVDVDAQPQRDTGTQHVGAQRHRGAPGTTRAADPGQIPGIGGPSGRHRPLTTGERRPVLGRIPGMSVRGGT